VRFHYAAETARFKTRQVQRLKNWRDAIVKEKCFCAGVAVRNNYGANRKISRRLAGIRLIVDGSRVSI
jgi:hypothetical protein